MVFRVPHSAAALLAAFWLTACAAETYWSKSGVSTSQMVSDRAQCRNLASKEVEKEFRLDQESLRDSPSGEGENYRARMMAFEARKRRNQLIERCMSQLGYRKSETRR